MSVLLLVPLTAACLAAAIHSYELPQPYVYAILKMEGGRVGQMVHNRNGTDDLGPFQINTAWGPAIGQYWHMPVARALERVRDNGCANAVIASAILKKFLIETKGDLPKAIGFYHSHTKVLAESYRKAVIAKAIQMADPFQAPPKPSIPTVPGFKQPTWKQAAPKQPAMKQAPTAAQ